MQPYIRSNARAVDRSLALKIRYSVSHRTSSRSPKHATDTRSPCGTPFKNPPRVLATGWEWGEMEFEMESRAPAEKSRVPKVGHHFGRSAARHPPDRPAAARLSLPSAQITVHHRESSGGVWCPWSMDLRQDRRGEAAIDLPRSPAVRFPAQSVGCGHLVPFTFHMIHTQRVIEIKNDIARVHHLRHA